MKKLIGNCIYISNGFSFSHSGAISLDDSFKTALVFTACNRVLKGGVQGEGVFLGKPEDSVWEDWGDP